MLQTLRDLEIQSKSSEQPLKIIDVLHVRKAQELATIQRTESRVFLLYCTKKEGQELMRSARELGLTTKEYVWIATQPVIGSDEDAPLDLIPGMLGVHFETKKALIDEIETAMTVFAHGLNDLVKDTQEESDENKKLMTQSDVSCYKNSPGSWEGGKRLR